MRTSRLPLVLLPLAGALALPTPVGAARTVSVTLKDIEFKPSTVRIKRGDSVRWVWRDGPRRPHNVRPRGSLRFKGSGTRTQGRHTVRFSRQGTHRYVCTVHPGMDGRVVVR